jgi:hypothetical protein
MMAIVLVDSLEFDTYASLADADEYLAGDFAAAAWRAESVVDNDRARALVTATRLLDRLNWDGEKTDPDQLHAWPRTGFTDLDEDIVPQPIIDASILLAREIQAGSAVDGQATTGSNVRRQRAGSVEIEYFNPNLLSDAARLPVAVEELVSRFLAGAAFGPVAFGTDSPRGCAGTAM